MAETLNIDSKERVAFDLTLKIKEFERPLNRDTVNITQEEAREYWLTLYQHCLLVVEGRTASDTLAEFKK